MNKEDLKSPKFSLGSPKNLGDAQLRIQEMELQVNKLRNGFLTSQNEFDKEKGLLSQKCENFEVSLQESREREAKLVEELDEDRKSFVKKMRINK